MTEGEFEEFIASSVDQLQAKQASLTRGYGLGRHARFWFDQPSGTLEFRDAQGVPQVRAAVVPIGSFSDRSKTWQWAWATESILPELRRGAEVIRGLATITGMEAFDTPTILADPAMSWELTAMAVHQLGAIGAYRAQGRNSDLYLAIKEIAYVTAEVSRALEE